MRPKSSTIVRVGVTAIPPNDREPYRDRLLAAEGLLEARQLLLAIAGTLQGGSPLIEWARELADLHATLITVAISATRRPSDFDETVTRGRVGTLIGRIDEWSAFHLPRPATGRRHTHSLGEVISHLAATYAQMQWTLRHSDSAQHHHDAALRFAQVQEGYADLVDEIRTLRVLLPLGWNGIGQR
ncbi:hypothetical protein OHB26_27635 [Nocardia sp. NBC_01503]|uniref:hypothetical protein n=1 Tax=Nocardia sp. NBC_01503 TaxID=2975997 RepID=UPI002E7B5E20|nr:hypothetical protein [Nocardia sp. NBC_01503]WTL30682.1 hypothetical protein OHB26_27635 [Nocardia sp. NBC_01503]